MARMSFSDLRAYMGGKLWANFVSAEAHISRDEFGLSAVVIWADMIGDGPIIPFNNVVYLRSPSMLKRVCFCGYVQEIKSMPPMGEIPRWRISFSCAPRTVRGRPNDVLAGNAGRFLPENAWRYKNIEEKYEDDGRYDR